MVVGCLRGVVEGMGGGVGGWWRGEGGGGGAWGGVVEERWVMEGVVQEGRRHFTVDHRADILCKRTQDKPVTEHFNMRRLGSHGTREDMEG